MSGMAREKPMFIRLGSSNMFLHQYQVTNHFPGYLWEKGEYMEWVDTPELDEHGDDNPKCGYNNPRSRTVNNPPPSQIPENPLRWPIADKHPTPRPSNNGDFEDVYQPQDTGKWREVEQEQEPDSEESENGDNGGGN
jgi:hypothetical protein